MKKKRHIYYLSDNTGLLAKDAGKSMLCQFPGIEFIEKLHSFIRSPQAAENVLNEILSESVGEEKPIIFSTILDDEINAILHHEQVVVFNICQPMVGKLETMLGKSALRDGASFRNVDQQIMVDRVDAIQYTIAHDDGTATNDYHDADLILVGVSRAGKTPISVFLATQLGLKTANYPLVEHDLSFCQLPDHVLCNKDKVIGLTVTAERLHTFREQRYQGSRYAEIATCKKEILQSKRIFEKYDIPTVFSDGGSIEETATQVVQLLNPQWKFVF